MEKKRNLWVISTDKPSRLYSKDGNHKLDTSTMAMDWYISSAGYKPQNIYITSDEEITGFENNIWVIKGNRIFLWQNTMALVSNNKPKKIILTTDQDLIKDGVQAIDDEFLEWFVKNPSCEEVKTVFNNRGISGAEKILKTFGEYKIITPTEEPKQETLEEAAERYIAEDNNNRYYNDFIAGAKWQQERMYSEEEVISILYNFHKEDNSRVVFSLSGITKWFEQFKKKHVSPRSDLP